MNSVILFVLIFLWLSTGCFLNMLVLISSFLTLSGTFSLFFTYRIFFFTNTFKWGWVIANCLVLLKWHRLYLGSYWLGKSKFVPWGLNEALLVMIAGEYRIHFIRDQDWHIAHFRHQNPDMKLVYIFSEELHVFPSIPALYYNLIWYLHTLFK